MRVTALGLAALCVALLPVAAYADDPHDPAMRSAAARARDHEIIRQLNRRELAITSARDARYAQGWRDWRGAHGDDDGDSGNSATSRSAHARAVSTYQRQRAQYERDMAAWRRAVAACNAGDDKACD